MHAINVAPGMRRLPFRGRLTGRWRLPMKIGSAVIGGTVLTFGAISALAAHWLTMPQRHPLAAGKTPGDLGVAFVDVRFAAHGDSTEIAGWFIPSAGSRREIVLVHGKDANRTRELDLNQA